LQLSGLRTSKKNHPEKLRKIVFFDNDKENPLNLRKSKDFAGVKNSGTLSLSVAGRITF